MCKTKSQTGSQKTTERGDKDQKIATRKNNQQQNHTNTRKPKEKRAEGPDEIDWPTTKMHKKCRKTAKSAENSAENFEKAGNREKVQTAAEARQQRRV